MDAVTRQLLKDEIDRRVRARNDKLKGDKSGAINLAVIRGDNYSSDWPPTFAKRKEVRSSYHSQNWKRKSHKWRKFT